MDRFHEENKMDGFYEFAYNLTNLKKCSKENALFATLMEILEKPEKQIEELLNEDIYLDYLIYENCIKKRKYSPFISVLDSLGENSSKMTREEKIYLIKKDMERNDSNQKAYISAKILQESPKFLEEFEDYIYLKENFGYRQNAFGRKNI